MPSQTISTSPSECPARSRGRDHSGEPEEYFIVLKTLQFPEDERLRWICDAELKFLSAAKLQSKLYVQVFILVIYQEFHCPFPSGLISRKDLQD